MDMGRGKERVRWMEEELGNLHYHMPCPTLCDPMECNLPGSSVNKIFQEEYWNGLPFPSSGDPPDTGIKPVSPALAGEFFITESPGMVLEIPTSMSPLSGKNIRYMAET